MLNYAIIENNVIKNTVVAEPDYAAQQNWVPMPEGAGIGFVFDGVKWENPNKPSPEELAVSIRAQRDSLLMSTDWTQAKDIPDSISTPWAPYRQALRDVPQQAGFPETVVWPVKP